MKTQTILDEYREKFTTSEKALGWTEIKFKNLLELESWLKEKLEQVERDTVEAVLKKTSHKPYCSEKDPCGCHFGETLHVDGKCFCDEVQKIVNSLQEEKV